MESMTPTLVKLNWMIHLHILHTVHCRDATWCLHRLNCSGALIHAPTAIYWKQFSQLAASLSFCSYKAPCYIKTLSTSHLCTTHVSMWVDIMHAHTDISPTVIPYSQKYLQENWFCGTLQTFNPQHYCRLFTLHDTMQLQTLNLQTCLAYYTNHGILPQKYLAIW